MAVWSAVSISALEYSRFDADFYHPIYLSELELWQRLGQRLGVAKLGSIIAAPVRTGKTPRSRLIKFDEPTIHFIKTDTVREGAVEFANSALLPTRVVSERDVIPANSVVMTIIGATPEIVGRAAIVRSEDPACVTNQNVAVISTKDNFDPFFLTAYLQTKWGRDQVWRHSRRTEQVNLNCREVERILVPNPAMACQEAIGNLVRDSFTNADLSLSLYQNAERLLEAELGLDKLTFRKPVGYIAQLSDVEVSRRFDPEHHFPALSAFCAGLPSGVALSPLSHHLQYCRRGKQPIYSETGLPVINSKHVQTNQVIQHGNRFALANPVADLQIRFGDILINGTGRGTIGRSAPYLSDSPSVADNHVTILRSGNLDPAYLSLYLNSAAGQMQVEMHQRGTSGQLELYPFDIRKLLVWDAPADLQQQLRGLHDEAAAAERKSKRLLEDAKTQVERLIQEAIQP